jgi:hypothetical protein
MALRSSTITIVDPGIVKARNAQIIPLLVGCCDTGSTSAIETLTSPEEALETYGVGPLSRAAGYMLRFGGGPIRCLRQATDAAGTCSAVTQSGGGAAMTVLVATAKDRYAVSVRVKLGGALGTARIDYALDAWGVAGLNPKYGSEVVVPANGEVVLTGTGITVDFAGALTLNTTYTFTSTAPEPAPDELTDFEDLLLGYQLPWSILTSAGDFADADDAYTNAAAADTLMQAIRPLYRHKRAIVGAGMENPAAVAAAGIATTLQSILVSPLYGEAQTIGAIPIAGYESRPRVPAHVVLAMRAAKNLFSTDPGRVASGPLEGVVAITHDEFVQQDIDPLRIGALRTWPTKAGFYVEKAWIKSAPASDFKYLQHGLIMDVACDIITDVMLRYVGETLRTEAGTGVLVEEDASDIQKDLFQNLSSTLLRQRNARGTLGHISALEVDVKRDNNILEDETLYADVGIQPNAYPGTIRTTLGFRVVEAA